MKRRTELTDAEQEAHDDAKADANAAAERQFALTDKLTDPRTVCEALKYNAELRCFAAEMFARCICLKPGKFRTAFLVEIANKIEREVSRA